MYQTLALAAIAGLVLTSIMKKPVEETYLEEARGNNAYGKYPPCYDICGATRSIYDMLESVGVLEEHGLLLDLYSIVLCQEKHTSSKKKCSDTMLSQRIAQLKQMGASVRDPKSRALVREYAGDVLPKDHPAMSFLVAATHLLERELARLKTSGDLTQDQMAKVKRLHKTFYMVHYDKIVCMV